MRSEGYCRVLAALCLGSFAGAVHAQEAWLRTAAVAAFPGLEAPDQAAIAPAPPPSAISEGADLNRELGPSRSARGAARLLDLLPNPYGSVPGEELQLTAGAEDGFEARMHETYSDSRWSDPYGGVRETDGDARWSNPYVLARNTTTDERWFNPYVGVQNTRHDERWFNPYVSVQDTRSDDRWSNPYAASVSR